MRRQRSVINLLLLLYGDVLPAVALKMLPQGLGTQRLAGLTGGVAPGAAQRLGQTPAEVTAEHCELLVMTRSI